MQSKPRKRRLNSADWFYIRWLVFCFPIGLVMLWQKRCHWPRHRKYVVTFCINALVLLILMPQTAPSDRTIGGVRVVSVQSQLGEIIGPEKPEGLTAQRPIIIREGSAPATQEPEEPEADETPVLDTVYINDGGKNYHVKPCRYIYNHTPTYELTARIASVYQPCPLCEPPVFN